MQTPISFIHPRDEILHTIERIYRYGMTTISGGNVSMRDDNGDIWITPSQVDKGGLRREDIVCVRRDGAAEGCHPPSSELPFHREIYQARPDIRAIVHAHPPALVAFSLIREVPNTHLLPQANLVCRGVGFAGYELPGSLALGRSLAATFRQGYDCVILENHGVAIGGGNLTEAFCRFETLEFVCKTIVRATALGTVRYLSEEQLHLPLHHLRHLPDFPCEPPSSAEKELRRQLAEFVRRAYHQRLFISTEGSFSARLDENSFLITPHRGDRGMLDARDFVLVREGKSEAGKPASWAAGVHEAIYRQHPGVGAVINAYPVHATSFGVTDAVLDTRTIPESYVVLRHVGRIAYGMQFVDSEAVARYLSPNQPVALLENEGALITGASVLEAYNRLEVLESTAEALFNARAIGTMAPMSDDTIRELEKSHLHS
ncbi:MAG TPA: class II aldolase/adducin family protein [Patescibacteria group bacterium]|nr:class II aldolase/adducin family protein [Patescibacteria group bacterium]